MFLTILMDFMVNIHKDLIFVNGLCLYLSIQIIISLPCVIESHFLNYLINNHKDFIFVDGVIYKSLYTHYFFSDMCEGITVIELSD